MLTKTTGVTAAYLCDPSKVLLFNMEDLQLFLWDVEENDVGNISKFYRAKRFKQAYV